MVGFLKFIGSIFLFLIAYLLFLPLCILNFIAVLYKKKSASGYFLSAAISLDKYGNREFRTLLNGTLIIRLGYQCGNEKETISSVLGKNQRDDTLTKTGKVLCWILDTVDRNHCKKSIMEIQSI